jgi:16S rRNA (cytosine967-C5)-methyltransferase
VVRRVFEHGAYADRALAAEAVALGQRDRSLAMQIAYGTVQRRATLDHVLARLVARPLAELDPAVIAALRIGLFQLLYLGGVADHAAVNESVELVKPASPGGARLVNAVLRRAAHAGRALLDDVGDEDPAGAAVAHSVPEWLARRWWEELGRDATRALLGRLNEPAESALRVNTLVSSAPEVAARLGVQSRPAPGLPEGLVLDGPFDAHGSLLWREGAIMPQSRASMLISRVLDAHTGQRVLDLCAAPGAKTTHLAALMDDRGQIVAVEHHAGRARALAHTCRRMRAGCVRVELVDAAEARAPGGFDRVLVDPPCSGLGTLQSRPDLRWRASPESVAELARLQSRILAAGAAATAPGGALVYSVCTISRAESGEVVQRFLAEHPQFRAENLGDEHPRLACAEDPRFLQLLPHRDRTDGFFVARFRRIARRTRR